MSTILNKLEITTIDLILSSIALIKKDISDFIIIALAVIFMFNSLLLLVYNPIQHNSMSNHSTISSEDTSILGGSNWIVAANAQNIETDTIGQKDFRLTIEEIGVNKTVKENVHPGYESVYGPVINKQIAHGKYTRLPDEATIDGNVYLFAHREGEYNGNDIGFFKNLHLLNKNSSAQIEYNGSKYIYRFRESFIIQPDDTWVYTSESKTPTLTLQTCENGITQRLIVKFDLVKVV